MNKTLARFGFAVAIAALTLSACQRKPAEKPPLDGATIGGPFMLTDQDGRPFSSDSLKGKYRIVYFGYTFCPDACPTDMAVLGKAMRQLDAKDPAVSAKIQPIFISVDPARDTPELLARYVGFFNPEFIAATGSDAELTRLTRALGLVYARGEPQDGTYAVDHSASAVLIDPQGNQAGLLRPPFDAAQIAADLGVLARSRR